MIPEMTAEMFSFALGEDSDHQKRGRILRIAVLNTQRIIQTDEYKAADRNGENFEAYWAGFNARFQEDVFRGLVDLTQVERAAFVMGARGKPCLLAAGAGELR